MKFLILSQRVPYPPNKGEKIRTYFQIEHLLHLGHSIDVCCPAHSQDDVSIALSFTQHFDVQIKYSKLTYKWFRLLSGLVLFNPLSVSNFYSRNLQLKIDQSLLRIKYDAIMCTSSSMAEYVFKSKVIKKLEKMGNKPILIMDFMDLDSDKWLQYSQSSPWTMKWIYKRESKLLGHLEKKIQQQFNHCYFISQNEVDLYNERNGYSNNIHVLGNGINIEAFYPAKTKVENPAPVFIFTGVMDYKPNIDAVKWFISNAWPLILDQFPNSIFIIAGMNPTPTIQSLNEIRGVQVTGFVDEILPYYHQAKYFVAPFTIARGVQNKILQAFACGLPVISSSMGAEGICCKDGEHIIIANTGKEYIDAIMKLETDFELYSRISKNALKLINEKYSWEGQLKALNKILI